MVCFICSKPGHISCMCLEPQRRPRSRTCNKVNPKGQPQDCAGPSVSITTEQSRKCMFETTVKVNGGIFKAFIDTGSEVNLIADNVVQQIGCITKKCKRRISGICGGTCDIDQIANTPAKIDEVSVELDFYLVCSNMLTSDILKTILSEYSSHIKHVRKKDGGERLCVAHT